MEQFSVTIGGKNIKVVPQDDGKFVIYDERKRLGEIYPEPGKLQLVWKSNDKITPQLVSEIGELITAQEIGKSIL